MAACYREDFPAPNADRDQTCRSSRSLPLASESQALLIMSGICGILLLIVGGAVIRMGVALAGLVLGTLAGWIAWGSLEIPVPSWLMMALGAIVFLCFAFLLARFVTGLLLGIIVAGWLVAVVLTWSLFDPQIEAPIRPVPTWIASTLVQQDDLEEVSQDEIDSESAQCRRRDARLAATIVEGSKVNCGQHCPASIASCSAWLQPLDWHLDC